MTKKGVNAFKELKIWQKAMDIARDVYRLTEKFPKKEVYGLSAQMRRCATSIPSNVAEGFRRQYNKEFKQFLYISLGSAAELETQLLLAQDFRYAVKETIGELTNELDSFSRMTRMLIQRMN